MKSDYKQKGKERFVTEKYLDVRLKENTGELKDFVEIRLDETKDEVKDFFEVRLGETKDELKDFVEVRLGETKNELKDFVEVRLGETKDELKEEFRSATAQILQGVDKIVVRFDTMEKDHAADKLIHDRHEQRLERIETKIGLK